MRWATVVAATVLAALAVSSALAATQGLRAKDSVSWEPSATIAGRNWKINGSCQNWNNTSSSCEVWNPNPHNWTCDGPKTYTFNIAPGNYTLLVTNRSNTGFAKEFDFDGAYVLTDAGAKVLASKDAFNAKYCVNATGPNTGNATDADITSLSDELVGISLAEIKGKGKNYASTGANTIFGMMVETVPEFGKMVAKLRLGLHSILTTFSSSTDWTNGTLYQMADDSGDLELSTITPYSNTFATNGTVSYYGSAAASTFDYFTHMNSTRTLRVTDPATTAFRAVDAISTNVSGDFTLNVDIAADGASAGSGNAVWYTGLTDIPHHEATTYSAVSNTLLSRTAVWISMTDGSAPPEPRLVFCPGGRTAAGQCFFSAAITSSVIDNSTFFYQLVRFGDNVRLCVFGSTAHRTSNTSIGCSQTGLSAGQSWGPLNATHFANGDGSSPSSPSSLSVDNFEITGGFNTAGRWNSTLVNATNLGDCSVGNCPANFTAPVNVTYYNATSHPGTSFDLQCRFGNFSWATTEATENWTHIANSNAGISGTNTYFPTNATSRFQQCRIVAYSNGTQTVAISSILVNTTRVPVQTGALAANATYARNGTYILFNVPYNDLCDNDTLASAGCSDHTSGQARLNLSAGAGTSEWSAGNNSTLATGNTSSGAYASVLWNFTSNGGAPTFTALLCDEDRACNTTNSSSPVTTDSAAPNNTLLSLGNSTNGTITLNYYANDDGFGINRSWLVFYNESNSTVIPGAENVTITANGTYTLCSTCHGTIRVGLMSDDAAPSGFRFNSSYSNQSFTYDTGISFDHTYSNQTTTQAGTAINFTVRASDNFSAVRSVWMVVTAPGTNPPSFNGTMTWGGETNNSGVWYRLESLQSMFGNPNYGEYQVQFRGIDQSSTDESRSDNRSVTYLSPGTQVADPATQTGGGGGGGGGGGAVTTIIPEAAAVEGVVAPGVLCPVDLRQAKIIKATETENSVWSFTCRSLVQMPNCQVVRGERVDKGGNLSGVPDPWWSCHPVGEDAVQFRYTVPIAQINKTKFFSLPTQEWEWASFARFRVGNGSSSSEVDARVTVTNAAAPLEIALPTNIQRLLMVFSAFSLPSIVVGAALVGYGYLRVGGYSGWGFYIAGFTLAVAGIGRVVKDAGGTEVTGILFLWVPMSIISLSAYYIPLWRSQGKLASLGVPGAR